MSGRYRHSACAQGGGSAGPKSKRKPAEAAAAEDAEDAELQEVLDLSAAEEAPKEAAAPTTLAEDAGAAAPNQAAQAPRDRIASGNAYMLMYKRRDWRCGSEGQPLALPPECASFSWRCLPAVLYALVPASALLSIHSSLSCCLMPMCGLQRS